MKVPHALSLHAVQVLPVLAFLLLFTDWSERRRTLAVLGAAAGYSGLVAIGAFQTFSGLAPLDLAPTAALLFILSAVLLGAAYTATLIALKRTAAREAHP